jgi:hypothetical protein
MLHSEDASFLNCLCKPTGEPRVDTDDKEEEPKPRM